MRVLVCGGRHFGESYDDIAMMRQTLESLHITTLICGGADGADSLAARWARRQCIPYWVFMADWNKRGKAAGPIRNREMLVVAKPDLTVAFPGGRGTADMVRQSKGCGVEVLSVKGET